MSFPDRDLSHPENPWESIHILARSGRGEITDLRQITPLLEPSTPVTEKVELLNSIHEFEKAELKLLTLLSERAAEVKKTIPHSVFDLIRLRLKELLAPRGKRG